MNDTFITSIPLLSVAIFIGLEVLYWRYQKQQEKKRLLGVQTLAHEMGFTLTPTVQGLEGTHWQDLPFFSIGRDKKISHYMAGYMGTQRVQVFDYHYVTGYGKGTRYWDETAVCFSLPHPQLVACILRPRTGSDILTGLFRKHRLVLTDYPAFGQAFVLEGQDQERIQQLFRREVIEFFLRLPNTAMQMDEQCILMWYPAKKLNATMVAFLLQKGLALLSLLDNSSHHKVLN